MFKWFHYNLFIMAILLLEIPDFILITTLGLITIFNIYNYYTIRDKINFSSYTIETPNLYNYSLSIINGLFIISIPFLYFNYCNNYISYIFLVIFQVFEFSWLIIQSCCLLNSIFYE